MESTHRRKVATFVNDIYPHFARKSINDITHQEIIKIVELKTKKGIEASETIFGIIEFENKAYDLLTQPLEDEQFEKIK